MLLRCSDSDPRSAGNWPGVPAGRKAAAASIRACSCSTRRSSRRTTCAASIRTELDEEGAYAIGRAYVEQFEPRRIAVGRDMRLSSPSMAAALIEGAADGGADVLDIGLVGTEMVYFAVGELGLDGGICVTASHNPKEYTGMKIVRRGALPVGGDSGLLDVRDRALRAGSASRGPARRRCSERDIWPGVRREGALVRRRRRRSSRCAS